MNKFLFLFLTILMLINSIGFTQDKSVKVGVRKVVIDAGHGGNDPGCIGYTKTKEKDIALSVVLKIGKLITENLKDVQVIYTRSTDEFIPLDKRAQIANSNKADLFISVHCNANPSGTPFGVETFVMGLHKSEANLSVAQRENSSILMEDNYQTKYDGFDPNSTESYIAISLLQNVYLDNSLRLASSLQNNIKDSRTDRGVKQAGFWVLYRTTMPSILIELGFLSNPDEEQFLKSQEGQNYMANSIFNAFKDYKEHIDKKDTKKSKANEATVATEQKTDKNTPNKTVKADPKENKPTKEVATVKEKTKSETSTQITGNVTSAPKDIVHPDTIAHSPAKKIIIPDSSLNTASTLPISYSEVKAKAAKNPKNESLASKDSILKSNFTHLAPTDKPKQKEVTPKPLTTQAKISKDTIKANDNTPIIFKVQIATSKTVLNKKELIELNAKSYTDNGLYKYTVGEETTISKAMEIQKSLNLKGYKDAFIVAFRNGKRIPLEEALKRK